MDKDTILAFLNSKVRDEALIITYYCLEKGKSNSLIQRFIQALHVEALHNGIQDSLFKYCYEYAMAYYIKKYSIILVYDKNNKFIKAF